MPTMSGSSIVPSRPSDPPGSARRALTRPAYGEAGCRAVAERCQAAVPVSVLGEDRANGRLVELRQRRGLRDTSPAAQVGLALAIARSSFVRIVVVALHRIVEHRGNRGVRDGRRVEEDENARPDAGRRQLRHGHPAPAVAHDGEVRTVEPGRADECRDRSGVVAERDLPGPVARSGRGRPGPARRRTGRGRRASAGPIRQKVSDDEVMPWTSRSGGRVGSPHARATNGIPSAPTRSSPGSGGASRIARTAAVRSVAQASIGGGSVTAPNVSRRRVASGSD